MARRRSQVGGAVLRVVRDRLHAVEHAEHAGGSEHVAERQGPLWIIETELDRDVDVGGRGDAQLGDACADIDDHGEQPLHDEAGAVVDGGHRRAVGQRRHRRGERVGRRQRGLHHRAAAGEAAEHVDGDGALRIEAEPHRRAGRVLAERRDEAERAAGRQRRRA